jgi:hypothetical protein
MELLHKYINNKENIIDNNNIINSNILKDKDNNNIIYSNTIKDKDNNNKKNILIKLFNIDDLSRYIISFLEYEDIHSLQKNLNKNLFKCFNFFNKSFKNKSFYDLDCICNTCLINNIFDCQTSIRNIYEKNSQYLYNSDLYNSNLYDNNSYIIEINEELFNNNLTEELHNNLTEELHNNNLIEEDQKYNYSMNQIKDDEYSKAYNNYLYYSSINNILNDDYYTLDNFFIQTYYSVAIRAFIEILEAENKIIDFSKIYCIFELNLSKDLNQKIKNKIIQIYINSFKNNNFHIVCNKCGIFGHSCETSKCYLFNKNFKNNLSDRLSNEIKWERELKKYLYDLC